MTVWGFGWIIMFYYLHLNNLWQNFLDKVLKTQLYYPFLVSLQLRLIANLNWILKIVDFHSVIPTFHRSCLGTRSKMTSRLKGASKFRFRFLSYFWKNKFQAFLYGRTLNVSWQNVDKVNAILPCTWLIFYWRLNLLVISFM